MKKAMAVVVVLVSLVVLEVAGYGQDAAQMEEQYKTCAQHYIPADKCTPAIYAQLKARDNAPLDPGVVLALSGLKLVQDELKNPESMQIRFVYVTEGGHGRIHGPVVCMEVGGQNSLGGMTVGLYAYFRTLNKKHPEREKMVLGTAGGPNLWGKVVWGFPCTPLFDIKLYPGQDITDQVKQALQR